MHEIHTEEELARFHATLPGSGVALVTFIADWCPPACRQRGILETVASTFANRAGVAMVDADKAESLCDKLEIRTLPSSLLFVKGELAESLPGFQQEQYLRDYLEHYLQQHSAPAATDR